PRRRPHQRSRAPPGLHPHFHRRFPSHRLGLRRRSPPRRSAQKISSSLRPARLPGRELPFTAKENVMKSRAVYLCALLLLLHSASVAAQEPASPAPRRITLEEAVQLALKHNHVVRIAAY